MTTYGLIGDPLSHSLSPLMHQAAFDALGVHATYELFPCKREELDSFFSDLRKPESPIFGLNVTVPHKETVLPYLDQLNPYAKKVSAVNTIVIRKDRKMTGFNTDGPGFLAHITELGFQPQNKRIVIFGAGGAARAILSVFCMIPQRPGSIKLFDVEPGKAQRLLEDLAVAMDCRCVQPVEHIDDLNIELADFLINATPLGMKPSDPLPLDPSCLHAGLFVYDVIYNPPETALLQIARQRGAKISNGLGMLFYQGVLSFQHWADIELSESIKKTMRQALEAGLKQRTE